LEGRNSRLEIVCQLEGLNDVFAISVEERTEVGRLKELGLEGYEKFCVIACLEVAFAKQQSYHQSRKKDRNKQNGLTFLRNFRRPSTC